MRIAICGIRGIPACYGGFETFAEQLSIRLVDLGHDVRVYGRKGVINFEESTYHGVEIKLLPAPKHKYFETPVHTLLCLIDLIFNPVDLILVCNAANSPFLFLTKLFRKKVAVNVDGIERKRAKWNALGRLWYRLGEITSVFFADELVADAEIIRQYYRRRYGRNSNLIRYGCLTEGLPRIVEKVELAKFNVTNDSDRELFSELEIKPGEYILYVSRFEPENNAHVAVLAYNALPKDLKKFPLVIVGDAPYAQDYVSYVKSIAGENIIFAGYRFGQAYQALQYGAYIYLQTTEVGGTHPALVEAMGFGNCIVANTTPEHIEVLTDTGKYYAKNNVESLREQLEILIANRELVADYRRRAFNRARSEYNWDLITNEYLALFNSMLGQKFAKTSQEKIPQEKILAAANSSRASSRAGEKLSNE